MKKRDTLDGNDRTEGAAVAAPRMKTWEILLDGHDARAEGFKRLYGTGLMVSSETKADARMQGQARFCLMHPKDVYVRDIEDALPLEYTTRRWNAGELESFTISRADAAAQKQWDLLVRDLEVPGSPLRSMGIQIIASCHKHAFVAANRLLPRMHTDMHCVRQIESRSLASLASLASREEPWSPEQVVRILEVFGALAPIVEQAPSAEQVPS